MAVCPPVDCLFVGAASAAKLSLFGLLSQLKRNAAQLRLQERSANWIPAFAGMTVKTHVIPAQAGTQ
ncbi:hypothetical protein BHQ29_18145 [Pseudomonas sp. LPH1]|nr:hypothetical protein BHQ29_18145 [Pseudomonas sp. LPH1]